MAGSRSSPPVDSAGDVVLSAVAAALIDEPLRGARIAVALSGGRDSTALLAAAVECGRVAATDLVAIHVHHGLSKHADQWAAFCERLARRLGIPLVVQRVAVDRAASSIEAAARSARYAALISAAREANASVVMLAHHQDDQAETLLLQLMRGAGVRGLAGMPCSRTHAGILWLRPLLDVARHAIDAFVRARNLDYVDDDSNASDDYRRNALRQRIVPALKSVAQGYPATIARAAAHQAEAARLIDDLAALDAAPLIAERMLDRVGLARLASHRARNVLRYFLQSHGLRPPSTAHLNAMLVQLRAARADAHIRLTHDGVLLGIHRGRIIAHHEVPATYERVWERAAVVELPHGRLLFTPTTGAGLAASRLEGRRVVVRSRTGGERIQLAHDRPRRALKAWLREAGMPTWQRAALPLVFCDDELVAVPGIGIAADYAALPETSGIAIDWQPAG